MSISRMCLAPNKYEYKLGNFCLKNINSVNTFLLLRQKLLELNENNQESQNDDVIDEGSQDSGELDSIGSKSEKGDQPRANLTFGVSRIGSKESVRSNSSRISKRRQKRPKMEGDSLSSDTDRSSISIRRKKG